MIDPTDTSSPNCLHSAEAGISSTAGHPDPWFQQRLSAALGRELACLIDVLTAEALGPDERRDGAAEELQSIESALSYFRDCVGDSAARQSQSQALGISDMLYFVEGAGSPAAWISDAGYSLPIVALGERLALLVGAVSADLIAVMFIGGGRSVLDPYSATIVKILHSTLKSILSLLDQVKAFRRKGNELRRDALAERIRSLICEIGKAGMRLRAASGKSIVAADRQKGSTPRPADSPLNQ